jgi:hypothetical protein
METAPLKSFATWARATLIREVTARVAVVLAPGSPERVEQLKAVAALESAVSAAGGGEKGRAVVADRVAYTWFNRIIALRFMDANGYTGVGVVSPERGREGGQPEVLAEAKRGNIDIAVVTDKRTVEAVTVLLNGIRRSDDPQGEAYALLLAEYCRRWNRSMRFMFEREGDYTELLIPAGLLADDSVLSRAVKVLTTDACQDVEVIGWLYQFYISERKDEVFAGFKKNKKAGAAEIPAATQLFTPHWIVRYLVENSVGRLWMLNHPSSRLVDQMEYYIAPVDEETDFLKISGPEELTVIDPACGSGHMLTYAFDLLYAIYEEEGYSPSEVPSLILARNLHGTEIDPRAGTLAAFALTMKARAKQRTFFNKQVEPNICVLEPIRFAPQELDLLMTRSGDRDREAAFWNQFEYADLYGSLIQPIQDLTGRLRHHIASPDRSNDLLSADVIKRANRVATQAEYLSRQYCAVVANPPYMGNKSMGPQLAEFAKSEYPNSKTDLFAMFIEVCQRLAAPHGIIGMITMQAWMFLGSFSQMRANLLQTTPLISMAHLGARAFDSISGEVVSTTAFIREAARDRHSLATFIRLSDATGEAEKSRLLRDSAAKEDLSGAAPRCFVVRQDSFLRIEGTPVAYSLGQATLDLVAKAPPLRSYASPRQGLITGDNDKFIRFWWEVSNSRVHRNAVRGTDLTDDAPWAPYLKGGTPRRWYGNELHVVQWSYDGREIRNLVGPDGRQRSRPQNTELYFRPGLTWSTIASEFAVRDTSGGSIFDQKGSLIVVDSGEDRHRLLGYLNSAISCRVIATLSPTLDFAQGPVGRIPVPDGVLKASGADQLISDCISISRSDWNTSELSTEFECKLLPASLGQKFSEITRGYIENARTEIKQIKEIESSLDRHYSALAGTGSDTAGDRPATLTAAGLVELGSRQQDASLAADLVSFAVGCIFGRYSLDAPGLILADQGAVLRDYVAKVPSPTFMPDEDNVIPIVDGDRFEDDIVARFREFLRVAFGEQHFEENLRFVTESLGVKDLGNYFLKSFYADHVKRYKKRPIYWLFSSPKGSFNALIYMHRYTHSTVSTVLNDYLREYAAKLKASLEQQERLAVGGGSPREQAAALKEAERLRKVLTELEEYEHDVLYPLASQQLAIDLDDGVKANYPKFGAALKKIPGLEASDE